MKVTDNTPEIFHRLLKDLRPEDLLPAALNLCTTQHWPPSIAQLRTQAAGMAKGVLTPDSGLDGWGRVLLRLQDRDVTLTEIDKKALAQTRSIYDLKRSDNIVADRSNFIKAWNHLSEKERINQVTLPEVKILATRNLPAFAEPKQLPQEKPEKYSVRQSVKPLNLPYLSEEEGKEIPTQEEVSGYIAQLGDFGESIRKGIGR
jgi:hypothetical protein